jgi:hypothetical protein
MARDAVTGAVTAGIVIASVPLMVLRKADALLIVAGAAVVSLAASATHIRNL